MDQITSEDIIRDSYNQRVKLDKLESSVEDIQELRSLQLTKRKEYEQHLNQNRLNYGQWIRYAKWEIEFNHDFKRARSIYERALQVNIEHVPLWISYIKVELSNSNINHARNLLDRAITILPKVDKFWYLYIQTEETLQNYDKVRQLFKNWVSWKPSSTVWDSYIDFEKRYEEFTNVRDIFKLYIVEYPSGSTWLKWIDFEVNVDAKSKDISIIRNVFELAMDSLILHSKEDEQLPDVVQQFCIWEFNQKEIGRVKEIFHNILDKSLFTFSEKQYNLLLTRYYDFERTYQFSDDVSTKRKLKYLANVETNPNDIDSWWLLIYLSQGHEITTYLEKATASVPPDKEKTILWKRYIYLWIRLCFHYEFDREETERARDTWKACVELTSSKSLVFGKVWINYAKFEIRQDDLTAARKVLGRCIGTLNKPKNNIFKYYISLEKKMGEWDRIRKIFEKWFELSLVKNTKALKVLLTYINFEKELEEFDRCESLYEIGLSLIDNSITSPKLTPYDMLYNSYINYYKENFEYDKARQVYETLIKQHGNVKIWILYAQFESAIPNETQLLEFRANNDAEFGFEIEQPQIQNTRNVFTRALAHYKSNKLDEERLIILQSWKSYETEYGDNDSVANVERKLPTIVKRTKNIDNAVEEYYEYIFPDETPNLNQFLMNAKKWAQTKNPN